MTENGKIDAKIKGSGFKNINSKLGNQRLLKERLKDYYISDGDARKYCIENNKFVYLLHILFDFVINDAYDYKWNYEEISETKQ